MVYFLIALVVIIVLIPVIFIVYLKVNEYVPADIENSRILRNNQEASFAKEYSLTTLNIGYCSLDESKDFFIEGGKGSRCEVKGVTLNNLTEIVKLLDRQNSDFYFLQEVDEPCRRSCYTNQVKYISKKFNNYNSSFVYNYKVNHVPVPIRRPMGSAISGLLSLSKYKIEESKRIQLKGEESFPKRLFFLKRCMMVNKYILKGGKELLLINIHLSAYDKGGRVRKQQVAHLIEYINEISKTNKYIIIGGDWNHLLDSTRYTKDMPEWVSILPDTLFETNYKIAYDGSVNTVRSEDTPYVKGQNFETIIDGFLVSPGIEVTKVETSDFEYKYTDHNPVTLKFKLLTK